MPTEQPKQSGKRNRNGLLTITREYVVDSEDECLTVGPATVMGCAEEDREWSRRVGGVERWDVKITYQGITEAESRDTICVKQVIREEPIESHPDIESIKKTYGGTENEDGTIAFPATRTTGTGGVGNTKRTTKNPMYGAKTYGRKSAQWTRTYITKSEPADIEDMAGRTSKKPKGAWRAPEGKIWVYGCAESKPVGSDFEITETATLEPEDVAKAVYGALV